MAGSINDFYNISPMIKAPAPGGVAVGAAPTPVDNSALQAALDALNQQSANTAGATAATAAANAAKTAGKNQSAKENQNTSDIVASLAQSLSTFGTGRDKQVSNAQTVFDTSLAGLLSSYNQSVDDSTGYAKRNEQDYDSKSNANNTNMVRESNDILSQVLSQGAGETDTLRALQQAAQSFDSNAQDSASSFNDTLRSINSQLANANSTAANSRLNTRQQQQDAISGAWNEYYKNMADTWTNIQRTEAQNTNINSDYSTAYVPTYGKTAVDSIAQYTGKVHDVTPVDPEWAKNWEGKKDKIDSTARLGNTAAAVSAGTVKRAEGATLRKW